MLEDNRQLEVAGGIGSWTNQRRCPTMATSTAGRDEHDRQDEEDCYRRNGYIHQFVVAALFSKHSDDSENNNDSQNHGQG